MSIDGNTDELRSFLSQTLESDSRTTEYRMDNCMHMVGTFPYNGGEMNGWFFFMEKQTALTRSIGKIEIVEEGGLASGIYLPMLYKSEDIAIGKPFTISIGSHKVTYTVCGFFNSIMMGSHNCTLTEMVLTEDQYTGLETIGYLNRSGMVDMPYNKPVG